MEALSDDDWLIVSVLPVPPTWLNVPQHRTGSTCVWLELLPLGTVCLRALFWFTWLLEWPPVVSWWTRPSMPLVDAPCTCVAAPVLFWSSLMNCLRRLSLVPLTETCATFAHAFGFVGVPAKQSPSPVPVPSFCV
jgi:hypothetical protein